MCLEAGVNLIDTADVYSDGRSEEIVGEVLRGPPGPGASWPPRCACRWGRGRTTPACRRHHIVSGCEASLRRLGTGHIDLYQVHEWDGLTPLEETLGGARPAGPLGQGALRRGIQLRRRGS